MTYCVNPPDEGRVIDCPDCGGDGVTPSCTALCETCAGHGWMTAKPKRETREEFDPPDFIDGPEADYVR